MRDADRYVPYEIVNACRSVLWRPRTQRMRWQPGESFPGSPRIEFELTLRRDPRI